MIAFAQNFYYGHFGIWYNEILRTRWKNKLFHYWPFSDLPTLTEVMYPMLFFIQNGVAPQKCRKLTMWPKFIVLILFVSILTKLYTNPIFSARVIMDGIGDIIVLKKKSHFFWLFFAWFNQIYNVSFATIQKNKYTYKFIVF